MMVDKSLSKKIYLLSKGKENYPDADVITRVDVKEKIQNAQRRLKDEVLDLSILEENKDLNVSEVVEKAIEEINKIFLEEFGRKLI